MKEYKELKNAAYFANLLSGNLAQLSFDQIQKDITEVAFILNHLISLNKDAKED